MERHHYTKCFEGLGKKKIKNVPLTNKVKDITICRNVNCLSLDTSPCRQVLTDIGQKPNFLVVHKLFKNVPV